MHGLDSFESRCDMVHFSFLTCRAAMLLRYTYNRVPSPLGESKEPTEAQMRIRELLMEKRQAAESRGAREGRQQ